MVTIREFCIENQSPLLTVQMPNAAHLIQWYLMLLPKRPTLPNELSRSQTEEETGGMADYDIAFGS